MPEVEYVYTKPIETKKSHKKPIEVLVLLVIIVIVACFLFNSNINNNSNNQNLTAGNRTYNNTYTVGDETYTLPSIPPEYKGSEGLDYVRNNSAPELGKAKSMCIDIFKGDWIDTLDAIGCYNMRGFSTDYCSMDVIQAIVILCNRISGTPECSITHVVCGV